MSLLIIGKSIGQTEQQQYEQLKVYEGFEVRHYPKAIVARVNTGSTDYSSNVNNGFRTLASYIFGGNEKNMKIAMTAPVQMGVEDKQSYMHFVMPSAYSMDELPVPNNQYISLEYTKPETVAAITFGGWASEERISNYIKVLEQLLFDNGIRHDDNFRYLGYNPPYRLINRRNEIVVGIQTN